MEITLLLFTSIFSKRTLSSLHLDVRKLWNGWQISLLGNVQKAGIMSFLFIIHGHLSQSGDSSRKQYGFYLIWTPPGTGVVFIVCQLPLYLGKLLGCITLPSYFRYKPGQVYLEKDVILPYVPNVDLCDHKCVLETQSKRSILLFFRGRLKRNAVSFLVPLPGFWLF
jgi:hypothetical protein